MFQVLESQVSNVMERLKHFPALVTFKLHFVKGNIAMDKVNQVSTSVFKAVATGEWDKNSDLILLKQRVRGVFLSSGLKENTGHCLLTLPRGKVNFLLFVTEGSFTTWSKVPTQILLFPFRKIEICKCYFPWCWIFKEMAFRSLRKIFLLYNWQEASLFFLFNNLHLKEVEEDL